MIKRLYEFTFNNLCYDDDDDDDEEDDKVNDSERFNKNPGVW